MMSPGESGACLAEGGQGRDDAFREKRERERESILTKIAFCVYHTKTMPFHNVHFEPRRRERMESEY